MNEEKGWISLHRKILDNPIICKDSDYFATWCFLLLKATYQNKTILFNGQKVDLKPGQFVTGRKKIAEHLKISESKVERILNVFENEQQIEQQKSNKNRIITVVNWGMYQKSEQQNERQLNTNNNINNILNNNIDSNNIKYSVENKDSIKPKYSDNNIYCLADARPCNDIPYQDIVDYLNSKIGSHYKSSSNKTRTLIHARFKEGFNADDFKTVIDKKTAEWLKDTKMQKFLRPETLFGTKFEGYLNQKEKEVTTGDIAKTMNWEELF